MNRQLTILFLIGLSLTTGCMTSQPVMSHEAGAMLERIVANDGGGMSFSRDHSHLVIETDNINEIVSSGTASLPHLVEILRNDRVSFDAFARCYSACDRILREIDPDIRILWYGGGRTKEAPSEEWRILPEGQMDVILFRKQVTADIVTKARQLGIKDVH